MPSKSGKQHRFMEMVAHDPVAAKRTGVPQSVGKEYAKADEAKARAPNATGRELERRLAKKDKK